MIETLSARILTFLDMILYVNNKKVVNMSYSKLGVQGAFLTLVTPKRSRKFTYFKNISQVRTQWYLDGNHLT